MNRAKWWFQFNHNDDYYVVGFNIWCDWNKEYDDIWYINLGWWP